MQGQSGLRHDGGIKNAHRIPNANRTFPKLRPGDPHPPIFARACGSRIPMPGFGRPGEALSRAELATDYGKDSLKNILLSPAVPRKQLADPAGETVHHGFELGDQFRRSRGIIGDFYGRASEF